jgi:hypothetical protein
MSRPRRAAGALLPAAVALVAGLALVLPVPSAAAAQSGPGARRAALAGSAGLAMEARYEVDVDLRWATRRVRVDTLIALRNTSAAPVRQVHLNTVAARLGGLSLLATEVDGVPVAATVDDQTISLPLPAPLEVEGEALLRVAYRARLRTTTAGRDHLFSQHGGVVQMYRFIPWLSRRAPFGPSTNGDPFVTPVSPSVKVTLRADRPLVWATSGQRAPDPKAARRSSASRRPAGGTAETWVARDVREFNVAASPAYRVTRGRSLDGETRIFAYTVREDGRRWLALARDHLARFERLLVPYPYPVYRLAETAAPTALESPALSLIPRGRPASNQEYLIAHETAHQWFYALVGNDQVTDAFADEALADFLARHVLRQQRGSRCPPDRLDRSIHRYSRACYYETIYIQGAGFLDGLRRDMGSRPFWGALRAYARDNRFGLAGDLPLLEAFRARFGDGVLPRFRERFPSLYR